MQVYQLNINKLKIKLESIDLPEELFKAFATKFCGWTEKVMTTTESPNYEVDNPVSYTDAIKDKYGTPIWLDIAQFNIEQLKEVEEEKIKSIRETIKTIEEGALEQAKEIITVTVE